MTPLAPLRMLLLGLFGWVLLGVGIYLAYDCYQAFNEPAVTTTVVTDSDPDRPVTDEQRDSENGRSIVTSRNDHSWWLYAEVAGATLCILFSMGGRIPVRLLFSQTRVRDSQQLQTPPPTKTLHIDRPCGSRLHCQVYGNQKGPTLVLTHGWSLASDAWRYLLPQLTTRFRVVTWDLAGLGKSKGPDDNNYSLDKMASDLRAVLDTTCPDGPVILIGHSIGGMIQQTFCRTSADKLGNSVKGLVLVHTTFTNPIATNLIAGIARPLQPLIILLNNLMIPLSPLVRLSNWHSYWNGSLHIAARLESFTGKQSWEQLDHSARLGAQASPAVVARGNLGMVQFDEQPTLPSVSVPVLVVSGTRDRLTVPSASERIEALLPNDRSYSDPGGHLGYWEYNEEVAQAIFEFAAITV